MTPTYTDDGEGPLPIDASETFEVALALRLGLLNARSDGKLNTGQSDHVLLVRILFPQAAKGRQSGFRFTSLDELSRGLGCPEH